VSGRTAVKARGRGVGREGRVRVPEAGVACTWGGLGAGGGAYQATVGSNLKPGAGSAFEGSKAGLGSNGASPCGPRAEETGERTGRGQHGSEDAARPEEATCCFTR
jgi:hypothetical protein